MDKTGTDQRLREAFRLAAPSVETDSFCRAVEALVTPAPVKRRPRVPRRLTLVGCAALVVLAGLSVGIFAAATHLGNGRPILVIGDQPRVPSSSTTIFARSDLFPVQSGDKQGYIDRTGRLVIPLQFDQADPFSDGLALVISGDKFGYIGPSGQYRIPPQFGMAGNFSQGLAFAAPSMYGPVGFINTSGKMVIPAEYEQAQDFSEGLAGVELGGRWGFIDSSGKVAIPFTFDDVHSFSEGLALAKIGNKWGYINKSGKWVAQPQYVEYWNGPPPALPFSEGLAAVVVAGEWGYIDQTGKQVIAPQFVSAGSFSEDLAPVIVRGKMGFIDTSGKMVIPAEFGKDPVTLASTDSSGFHNGLALAAPADAPSQMGYIDKSGKFVIPPQNGDGRSFLWGPVAEFWPNWPNHGWSIEYIDPTGRVLFEGIVPVQPLTVTS